MQGCKIWPKTRINSFYASCLTFIKYTLFQSFKPTLSINRVIANSKHKRYSIVDQSQYMFELKLSKKLNYNDTE